MLNRTWPGAGAVDVAVDSEGAITTTRLDRRGHPQSTRVVPAGEHRAVEASGRSARRAWDRDWQVEGTGFWQVHPGAADALVGAVAGYAALMSGERVLDLNFIAEHTHGIEDFEASIRAESWDALATSSSVSLEQEMLKAGEVSRQHTLNMGITKAFDRMLKAAVRGS